ncbi:MAG TPA: 3',5'-cyclic-AMP phosphodiesterase [Steroidobacteraceae bacterium]|nr:3',5'-cyclic-AMP phosphodiesterase [Steroidobacteraceae bacterium]
MRLLQFTDPHLYADRKGRLRGVETYSALLQVIEHARRHHWPCDGVLATGDLVQDDPGGYDTFREVFGSLGVPIYCIPGNHDELPAMRGALTSAPYQLGGTLRRDGWQVVMLDSCIDGAAAGHLSAASLATLEQSLTEGRDLHSLVCLHHQPVPMGSRWLDDVGLRNAGEFLDVLDRHRNVRGVLWGHVHQAYDGDRGGVHYMSTPSTCAQFLPGSEHFELDRRPPGYRWLELGADGTIGTRVVWA